MTESERRRVILEAAARLFEHYGYAKTTMADVAREAQIGVGTVYLEFDSKEAIVQELSSSTHAGVLKAMRASADKSTDDAKRLAAVLMARTDCFLELRNKGQHACELLHQKTEGVRVAKSSFNQAELALFEEIIERGQASGAFGAGSAARIAALIQRAFASLSPPWIFMDDAASGGAGTDDAKRKRAIASELCQLLLDGVVVRAGSAKRAPTSEKTRARRNRIG
jgi:AcrR family transcriptional regulator